MAPGDNCGILVEPGLPIMSGIVWQVRKVEESWLFKVILFLQIGGVHLLRSPVIRIQERLKRG